MDPNVNKNRSITDMRVSRLNYLKKIPLYLTQTAWREIMHKSPAGERRNKDQIRPMKNGPHRDQAYWLFIRGDPYLNNLQLWSVTVRFPNFIF